MQKLTLTQTPGFKGYLPKHCIGNTIHYLGYFIIYISLNDLNSYIDWAKNPAEEFIFMNVAFLEKDDNQDCILIGSQMSDEKDWGPFYKITVDEFIKLLTIWKELVDANTKIITISDNEGILTIEGT